MKFHKPLFAIIIIITQLILTMKSYYDFVEWGKANPELERFICRIFLEDSLFIFVLSIGFYEMLTKPSVFKTLIRILLVCILLGTNFSGFVPINGFYYGVYNTAWFSAVVALLLIVIRIGMYIVKIIIKNRSIK